MSDLKFKEGEILKGEGARWAVCEPGKTWRGWCYHFKELGVNRHIYRMQDRAEANFELDLEAMAIKTEIEGSSHG